MFFRHAKSISIQKKIPKAFLIFVGQPSNLRGCSALPTDLNRPGVAVAPPAVAPAVTVAAPIPWAPEGHGSVPVKPPTWAQVSAVGANLWK